MNDTDELEELAPGTLLQGKYRIERKLGGGGMSRVYLATHEALARRVAIKVVAGHDNVDRLQALRLREGRLRSQLTIEGVVQFIDTFVEHGRIYLVEEFVDGVDLGRWQQGRSLPEVLAAYASVAHTLAGLHAAYLVHRDVKPSNILIAVDGRPLIADFGLAVRQREVDSLTATGTTIIGTPTYMAPEIMRGAHTTGGAVDVYALGVMLFEWLTGKLPGGADPSKFMEMAVKRLRGYGAEDLAALDSVGSPRLRSLVTRMLSVDPNDRPSADAVASELRSMDSAPVDAEIVLPAASTGAFQVHGQRPPVPVTFDDLEVSATASKGVRLWAMRALPLLLVLGGVLLAWQLLAGPTVERVALRGLLPALAGGIALIAGVALVVVGLRRAPPKQAANPAVLAPVMARIQALEAHIKSRDQLTESVAMAVEDIGSRLDPERLASIIRESVLVALKELSPRDLPGSTDMARALETIAQLTRPKETRKSFWERWGSTVTVCSGTVSLAAGIFGLFASMGVISPNHSPEIKAIGPADLRARSRGTLVIPVDASDPDGDSLQYSYSVDQGTVEGNGNSARWTPPADRAVRAFQLQVKVTDDRRSVERSRTVMVNLPPTGRLVITPPAGPGGAFRIEARAEDADGDTLRYQWRDSTAKLSKDAGGIVFLDPPKHGVVVDVVCEVSDGLESVTLDGRVP